jgi:signal transduction histidine kinase/ActR/RegA family two-component response regulator
LDISVTISPIRDQSGRIVGASKVARDITEQKRALRELKKLNEELQRANRMNSEFFAVMSHELRTPLNAIAGWVQILRDKHVKPDQVAHGLEIIERNTWAQVEMINDLLDMSRIVTGKLKLDLQRVDLPYIVSSAVDTIRPSAEAKGLRLTAAISSVPGGIMGDETRLLQIIGNLLSNAVKFTPNGGKIHVALERVNSHVEITVADNGRGIKPEFLNYVFDRFRQEDSSTTRKQGGLGLGLAIVKQLTEMHGGSVHARSEGEGRGATFVVSLPVIAAHEMESDIGGASGKDREDEEIYEADLTGVKVLVVDDEADSREVMRCILEARHATVETAKSVGQGIARFADFAPHVVLSDIGMPEQNGFELLQRLRTVKGGEKVPVVAVTALARAEDRSRALRAGFQVHLAKPIHAEELVAVVRNLSKLGSSQV